LAPLAFTGRIGNKWRAGLKGGSVEAPERPRKASLLITGGCVATMNGEREVLLDGAVAVDEDRIVAVGDRTAVEADWQSDQVLDATDCIVLPGLVNAHTHAFQTLFRGLGDDLLVFDWLKQMIYPLSSNLRAEQAYAGTRLACLEMIRSGISAFTDSFYVIQDPDAVYRVAEAAGESGLRAVLGRAVSDQGDRPREFNESTARAVDETERFVRACHGRMDGRIQVCAEALYTLFATPELVAGLREVAARHGLGFHMHAGEALEEARQIRRETGSTIVSYLSSIDALGPNVLLFHAVWLSDPDIRLLAETGTAVANCPVSNGYLANGVAPVPAMLQRGVTVALGTDGAASNNSQNMIECLKAAVLLQKAFLLDERALSAETALEMATINGAAALGLPDTGALEAGKKADIALMDLRTPNATPALRPISSLVYTGQASDVRTLIVDGRIVMRDREVLTMDEDEVIGHARDTARHLVDASGTEHLLTGGRFRYR
jgi:5-methylthioadenosine/S-adenosylhomocysteine deaminase